MTNRLRPGARGQNGRVDGRLVVLVVFGGALLLWSIVFMQGLKERDRSRQGRAQERAGAVFRDSTAHPDTLRAWLGRLPAEWSRVTFVEGQGLMILVPCYSQPGTLSLRLPPDSLPQVNCEYCDSLTQYAILGMARIGRDSIHDLLLHPPAGSLRVLPVTDSLLQAFPDAAFRDRILLWTRNRRKAGDMAGDTLLFVPKSQESEFEVLRAEDENPEGCGPEAD